MSTQHIDNDTLRRETQRYKDKKAVSSECMKYQFLPAFFDTTTQKFYLSRTRDGNLAPLHLLDGLPEDLIAEHAPSGQPIKTCTGIISGFVREGKFYTRDEAAAYLEKNT